MLPVDVVTSALRDPDTVSAGIIEINLTEGFQETEKGVEPEDCVEIPSDVKLTPSTLRSRFPERRVVALDASSLVLGYSEEGVVGVIRAAVVVKEPGVKACRFERYGPFLICFTHQNREVVYRKLQQHVFGVTPPSNAPRFDNIVDRIRNLLEKHLQLEIARNYGDALILFDGALTSGTVDSPKSYLDKTLDAARNSGSDIASVSKHSTLTLKSNEGILAPLKGFYGPCLCDVTPHIKGYYGKYQSIKVYGVKMTPLGEPFRVDIPISTPTTHMVVLSEVSGLAGDYGYPEELKLAHVSTVFSSVEALELQASAIKKYRLELREDVRKKIFGPWG